MFAQVGVGALPKLAGGALLREAPSLARSPFLRPGPETSSAGGPGVRAGGRRGPEVGKGIRAFLAGSGCGAELWGAGWLSPEARILWLGTCRAFESLHLLLGNSLLPCPLQ